MGCAAYASPSMGGNGRRELLVLRRAHPRCRSALSSTLWGVGVIQRGSALGLVARSWAASFCFREQAQKAALISGALPGAPWRFLALPGASWRFLALPGASWRFLAHPSASWRFVAPPGVSWRALAFPCASWPGASWRFLALPGASWRFLALFPKLWAQPVCENTACSEPWAHLV